MAMAPIRLCWSTPMCFWSDDCSGSTIDQSWTHTKLSLDRPTTSWCRSPPSTWTDRLNKNNGTWGLYQCRSSSCQSFWRSVDIIMRIHLSTPLLVPVYGCENKVGIGNGCWPWLLMCTGRRARVVLLDVKRHCHSPRKFGTFMIRHHQKHIHKMNLTSSSAGDKSWRWMISDRSWEDAVCLETNAACQNCLIERPQKMVRTIITLVDSTWDIRKDQINLLHSCIMCSRWESKKCAPPHKHKESGVDTESWFSRRGHDERHPACQYSGIPQDMSWTAQPEPHGIKAMECLMVQMSCITIDPRDSDYAVVAASMENASWWYDGVEQWEQDNEIEWVAPWFSANKEIGC